MGWWRKGYVNFSRMRSELRREEIGHEYILSFLNVLKITFSKFFQKMAFCRVYTVTVVCMISGLCLLWHCQFGLADLKQIVSSFSALLEKAERITAGEVGWAGGFV